MKAIVSVTRDWGIGYCGRLAISHLDDMRRFRERTMGGTVIMGRKTFQSLPNGPLPGRRNVVITGSPDLLVGEDVVAVDSDGILDLALREDSDCWVIGGESVYRQLLPYCTDAYVTFNDISVPVDRWFPNLDEDPRWDLKPVGALGATWSNGFHLYTYEFRHYVRKGKVHELEAKAEGQAPDGQKGESDTR